MPKYERLRRGFMKVNELSKAASIPASTIRYYAKMGLIKPVMDTKSGYHLFELEETIKRIEMVRQVNASKPTLQETKEMVDKTFGNHCGEGSI